MKELKINRQSLDALMPMNLQVDAQGRIVHLGPTLARVRPESFFMGRSLFDVFDFKRLKDVRTVENLKKHMDVPLRLQFRDGPRTTLRGAMVAAAEDFGLVLNLSFGLSILDAIKQYKLHSRDFATTDPTIEMLYLIEAKSAAMEESHDLNMRLQGAKIAAEEQAFTDTLTGLKNRRALDHVLQRYCEQGVEFSLLGVDLDFFKSVNDSLGHAAGDHVLQRVARIMVDTTKAGDTLVRSGGDEFVVVLRDQEDVRVAKQVADRLIQSFEEPIPFGNDVCRISASIGIASTRLYKKVDVAEITNDADAALYASKRLGRAQATVFKPGMEAADVNGPPSGARIEARTPPNIEYSALSVLGKT